MPATSMGNSMSTVYDQLLEIVSTATAADLGITQLIGPSPRQMERDVKAGFVARAQLIRDFQKRTIDIFRASLAGDLPPEVLQVILNDAPLHVRAEYHRALADTHWTVPAFFRTDEAAPGRIMEIQCPGSLWGE